jgi:UDP-2-acetamido-2,6-beta-L-arabino-hexul-4-ose reductase
MNQIKVGVTGYTGFIGSHLVDRLSRESNFSVIRIEDDWFKSPKQLKQAVQECGCIVHFAGMNRGDEDEIYTVNIGLAEELVSSLEETKKTPHVIFASSILSGTDTAFGRSKKEACEILGSWGTKNGAPVSLLTIPNVFGDRGKPFYNSVVATFCHQLAHGEEPKIIQDREVEFIYINELTELICKRINDPPKGTDAIRIEGTKMIMVSEVLSALKQFKDDLLIKKTVPDLNEPFLVNLYNVFVSYLEKDALSLRPEKHADERGEFYEIFKSLGAGQVSFSMTKPGMKRGNHYHTKKIEKFCFIKGSGVVRMRRIGTEEIKEFKIEGPQPTLIEIPIFHTHHIENTGREDLFTLFWTNELFDQKDPDTFFEEV